MQINKIHKDDSQNTTDSINKAYLETDKILIILSEKDKSIYNFDKDHRKLKFNSLLDAIVNDTKIVINISKFTLLSWQGLIKMCMYSRIIIRSNEILKSFVHAFKNFYVKKIFNLEKPRVDIFVQDIDENLCLYFQSTIEHEFEKKPFIKCISLNPLVNDDLLNYIKIKRTIKNKIGTNENFQKIYDQLLILEKVGIFDVISFLKTFVKFENVANIETSSTDKENAKDLWEYYEKKKIILEMLNENHVVLYSKNVVIDKKFSNLMHFCICSELSIKNISTMAYLVLWDDCLDKHDWLLSLKFKKIIFFKTNLNFPDKFTNLIIKNKNTELSKFNNYLKTPSKEYYTEDKTGILSWEYSIQFLEHIMYMITNLFSENFLFFRNFKIIRKFENFQNGSSYLCLMELPKFVDNPLFTEVQKSNVHIIKKECCKDVSFNFIIKLYKNGFLDKNFLPVKQKFINNNNLYHDLIKKLYKIEYIDFDDLSEQITTIKDEFEDFEKFKKFYSIDFEENLDQVCDIDEILRKQAECFKNYNDEMYIYCFNNSNVGIACSKSFTETVFYKQISISYIDKIVFSKEQKDLLLYYQILFFGINFKRMTNMQKNIRSYCYFVLPMKNLKIDFNYLNLIYKHFFFGNVKTVNDINIFNNFLLFNPVTKLFYEYNNDTNLQLSDPISIDMYKILKKSKKGKNLIDDNIILNNKIENQCYLNDTINNDSDKMNLYNYDNKALQDNPKGNKSLDLTISDYFTKIYGVEIENLNFGNNIIFECVLYSSKNKIRKPEIHSGEIMYVTSIKKSIRNDYNRFVDYFYIFESIAIAQEFKEKLKLEISLPNIALAFTSKNITGTKIDLGYERFEFLGDSVLKFAITKFLFKDCGFPLNKLVTKKDSLICNNNLYKIGQSINLNDYFSFNKYNENLFQPPAILDLLTDKSLINNLGVERVFLNNNQYYFVVEHSKKKIKIEDDEFGKKVYADIIESLIGVHYIEYGFEKAWKFIQDIGIINSVFQADQNDSQKRIINNFNVDDIDFAQLKNVSTTTKPNLSFLKENYFICDYEGILPVKSINLIEGIINYKFKNKGYIEKAMIHPSYNNNMFGSERFQKLELIGDCFYDLKVSDYIYKKFLEADPCELHTHRKRLVNNHTFAMILFKTGLVNLAKTGLTETSKNVQHDKISKCYSDIFEALAGAVVIDSAFSFKTTNGFFEKMLTYMKENSRDC